MLSLSFHCFHFFLRQKNMSKHLKAESSVAFRREARADKPYRNRDDSVRAKLSGKYFQITLNKDGTVVVKDLMQNNMAHYQTVSTLDRAYGTKGRVAFGIGTWGLEPYNSELVNLIGELKAVIAEKQEGKGGEIKD